jgi:hypothetical protein
MMFHKFKWAIVLLLIVVVATVATLRASRRPERVPVADPADFIPAAAVDEDARRRQEEMLNAPTTREEALVERRIRVSEVQSFKRDYGNDRSRWPLIIRNLVEFRERRIDVLDARYPDLEK